MAQTNFTPILTYKSDTATSVPSAGNLTNSANGAELAVNTADKRLFTKDSGGNVVEVGTNPSSLTMPNGTANGVVYANGSKVLTSGSALTFNGTNLYTTGNIYGGSGNANANILAYSNVANGGAGFSQFLFANTSSETRGFLSYSHAAEAILFGTSGSEQMRLTSTGLGIGTSSPSAKLHVKSSSTEPLWIESSSASNFVYTFYKSATGNGAYTGVNGNGDFIVQTPGSSYSTKLTLDSSGNLGLGVTPSAWSFGKAFEFGYTGNALWSYSQTDSYITNNARFNSGWKYASTAAASQYRQSDGAHYWNTAPSGTAGNAISFTQAMTLDASGNLSVGTTSTAGFGRGISIGSSDLPYLDFYVGSTITGRVRAGSNEFFVLTQGASTPLILGTNNTERARIDSSGNLLLATTSTLGGAKQTIYSSNLSVYTGISIQNGTAHPSGAGAYISFYNSAGSVAGYINQTGTTTVAYTTSSDYRLKENITPMTGALAKVAQLKPVTYKWKSDGLESEGFIAHELAEVCPQAVVGEKDAVDAEGNPKYQGIDTSFLVATLTAAIQELKAEFDAYKASHP